MFKRAVKNGKYWSFQNHPGLHFTTDDGGAGGDSGGAGGGGGTGDAAPNAELTAKLADALAQIDSLKKKNTDILGEKKKQSEQLKAFDGLDPENIRNILNRFDQDEELKLISEGKYEDVIKARVEKAEAGYKSTIASLTEENSTLKEQTGKDSTQIRDLIIDTAVTTSFIEAEGVKTAVPDVILRAKNTFTVENGEAIARDGNGEIIAGSSGPLKINEWVATLKETAPHLFPGSQGAGAGGSGTGGSNVDAKMAAAAASGNMKEYRRLRAEKASKNN